MRVLASSFGVLSFSLLALAASGASCGGAAPIPTGDCTTDAECNGGRCVELTPGGYKTCAQVIPEATTCTAKPPDECCTSADCGAGKCYSSVPLTACTGQGVVAYNQCLVDGCQTDAQCDPAGMGGACLPAGVYGVPVRFCIYAYCHTSAECTVHPGGVCAAITHPSCCAADVGMACVYPGGCTKDADCPEGQSCQLTETDGGTTECVPGPPSCPF